MHIEFKTEGGVAYFPGLSKPVTIDGATLSEREIDLLHRLLKDPKSFSLDQHSKASGVPDGYRYTIIIKDSELNGTVQIADPIHNPELQGLISSLSARAKELRRAARGTS